MKEDASLLRTRTEGRCDPEAPIKAELDIMREKAEALGQAGRKVDESLQRLKVLEERIGVLVKEGNRTAEINALIREFNQVRETARQRLHHLIIHREAIGFRRHAHVKKMYSIPLKKQPLSDAEVREDHHP
jgi:hypothetical protein